MKQNTALILLSASCLFSGHTWAADMNAASVIAEVQNADKSCTQGAPRLPVDGVKIGSAVERNQIQTDNGWKRDGVKGKSYLILSTRQKGKLIAAASYGPLDANTTADAFKVLLKSRICMVDEG